MQRAPTIIFLALFCFLSIPGRSSGAAQTASDGQVLRHDIAFLSSLGDRSTGTDGCRKAAAYIKERLTDIDAGPVDRFRFRVPVRRVDNGEIVLPGSGRRAPLRPLLLNAIAPESAWPELSGPLIYVGRGTLREFNRQPVDGAIVLMAMDSGKNWMSAAELGAKALIYVDGGLAAPWESQGNKQETPRMFFDEKAELSPLTFPRFWMARAESEALSLPQHPVEKAASPPIGIVRAQTRWVNTSAENIYCVVPGRDPQLKDELVLVEAFYDSTVTVAGLSPGADEAFGAATLLALARLLKEQPPARTVVLAATAGHAQTLAGMRELVWLIRAKSDQLKKIKKTLSRQMGDAERQLAALSAWPPKAGNPDALGADFRSALEDPVRTAIDAVTRKLMALRIDKTGTEKRIQALANQRTRLRHLSWREDYRNLTPEEVEILNHLVPQAVETNRTLMEAAGTDLKYLKEGRAFRDIVKSKNLAAVISLHLSSHGTGVGAFSRGWLYPLSPKINRVGFYHRLNDALDQAAGQAAVNLETTSLLADTLRPSRLRPWQSYFADQPALGGEVSALAGYPGISLVTVNDLRPWWGTPHDLPDYIDWPFGLQQSRFVVHLLGQLMKVPKLKPDQEIRNGFATVAGRANFLRYGELFADQAAPDTTILAYQGPAKYHVMTRGDGSFWIKGIADKKHVLDKLIIEGYRFDPQTGEVMWSIDKRRTGKDAYRLKIKRRHMETDLVMFACRQTTLFNLLEPRTFNYLTKIDLLDGRSDAPPLKYWFSRIDTRASTLASVFLEPRTRLKLTLSDTVLRKKMILTRATPDRPEGIGYSPEEDPVLFHTPYRTARDMWALVRPRIDSLETHGIHDEKLDALQKTGLSALAKAGSALAARRYGRFREASSKAWALASRVYDQVENIQKDVLMGVLFFIALFVPFAYCAERLLLGATDIHKRITAFLVILAILIAVIYNVHPAFELSYSPLVVILAFFIMGLSGLVTIIIFMRFETEMMRLQRRSGHVSLSEISRWKAFAAAFFIGVSNLRRRKLRSALTCLTLILLTFTIMSFTTVKSIRRHAKVLYRPETPYSGYMFRNINWRPLPPEAAGALADAFDPGDAVAPRAWLEGDDPTRAEFIPISCNGKTYEAKGIVGLSAAEDRLISMAGVLTAGRWMKGRERDVVWLPQAAAAHLGIRPETLSGARVSLWGMPFRVAGLFSGPAFDRRLDLDGEPPTPATFTAEVQTEMTETEMEALEEGTDMRSFQSRYRHVDGDLTVILPYETVMAMGGKLKSVAVRPSGASPPGANALVDRFGLYLFSGESGGTYLYQASDTLSYTGIPNIMIPLILSVLIVLNTMIGSVYERKREIQIYTSVGLAPTHVGFLFVAEAAAFAVLSVVVGYIIAQSAAYFLADTPLWAGVTVNYSSLAGVGAMVLVMAVVLVSALYPAKTAADIAVPDVNRSWKMPPSMGPVIALALPFMVKIQEMQGILKYLETYFRSHQDVSHGAFSTDRIQTGRLDQPMGGIGGSEDVCARLTTDVWLAPFDFGIMQHVSLDFCPMPGDANFLKIKVNIQRKSGEAHAWWRVNKVFLNGLRKQLLVWRSLSAAERDEYSKEKNIQHRTLNSEL